MKNSLLIVLVFLVGCALGISVKHRRTEKCDCSEGIIFTLDSASQIKVYRQSKALMAQGDSTSAYVLQAVLMNIKN